MTFLKSTAGSSRKWFLTVALAVVLGLAGQASPAQAIDLNMVSFGGNMIVFSACLSTQLSGEDSANGYFTKCFLEGLSGKADFNKDGKVTLAEIDAYVSDKLDTYNKGKQPKDHQQCTVLRPANIA